MQVPAFLLRRLYVKGSLRATAGGFAFDIKNSLGSGYAEQVLPLRVDDEDIPPGSTRFIVDGAVQRFDEVSAERPVTLGMNRVVTIEADGRALAAGKHKIALGFVVVGMGRMVFDVTDALADA